MARVVKACKLKFGDQLLIPGETERYAFIQADHDGKMVCVGERGFTRCIMPEKEVVLLEGDERIDANAKPKPESYKDRMAKEYIDLRNRYSALHRILTRYDAGKLDFKLNCPVEILRRQKGIMGQYLYILEVRAEIEGIDLVEAIKEEKRKAVK